MTEVERFEDTKAWQEASALVKMVYKAVKTDKGFFIQGLLSKEKHSQKATNSKSSIN